MKILNSSSLTLTKKYIDDLKKKSNKEFVNFHYDEKNFNELLLEISQNDLFSNEKVFVISNSSFLNKLELFKKEFKVLKKLQSFLSNQNEISVIFITDKAVLKNKDFKSLFDDKNIKVLKEYNSKNISSYIEDKFKEKNVKVSNDLINYLSLSLGSNLEIIEQEINKLIIHDEITLDLVKNLISSYKEINVFKLHEYLLKKDLINLINLLENMYEQKHDPIQIINILSTQFFNSWLIKKAKIDYNISDAEISNIFKINPFVIKIQNSLLKNWNLEKIEFIISDLHNLDVKIKNENLNKFTMLKSFLIRAF